MRKATLDIPVIRQEIEARGQTHSFQVLKQAFLEPPVPVASRLGLPPGIKLLFLETLHLADGKPFAFESRWLNSEILPRPMPDFQALSANEWLVAHVAYVTGDIAFSAEGASPREAAVLARRLPGRDFGYFLSQRGMFSYTGLSAAQVDQLREQHAVYLIRSGRICVAGLNTGNVDRTAEAMAAVLRA